MIFDKNDPISETRFNVSFEYCPHCGRQFKVATPKTIKKEQILNILKDSETLDDAISYVKQYL